MISQRYYDWLVKILILFFKHFLTAMMIAHKFLDEPVCSNKQWSLVGDLTVKEMNSLELHMLWTLQFDCNVSRAEYDACQAALGKVGGGSSFPSYHPSPPGGAVPHPGRLVP